MSVLQHLPLGGRRGAGAVPLVHCQKLGCSKYYWDFRRKKEKIHLVPFQQWYWAISPLLVLQRQNICDTKVKSKGFVRTQGFILLDKSRLERTNKHKHIFIMQNWILLTFLTTCKEKAFGVSWMCTEKCRMRPSRDATSEVALTWSQDAEPEPRDSYKSSGQRFWGCFALRASWAQGLLCCSWAALLAGHKHPWLSQKKAKK